MSQNTVNPTDPVDYRRKWFVMAAVASGIFLATIDGSIVNVALPTLQNELSANFAVIQWVVLGYLLTVATLMLAIGRLADMYGKKTLYLVGFIFFTVGSGLCGTANNVWLLIAFRVFQAIGAAMTMALGTAIVTEEFPPQERGKALGITGLMVSIGAISGPTVGGLILGVFSWHWIFFVNLPIGVIGIILVIFFVPARKSGRGEKFDFRGAATLFVSLSALLFALTFGQDQGFTAPLVLGLFALSLIFLVLFISIQRSSVHPLIDLSLFSNNLFSVNLITGFLTFVCSAGTVLLMPFFLQDVLKYNPQTAGLLLSVVPLSMGAVAPISGSLSDRFGSRKLTAVGLAILLVGYIAVSTLSTSTTAIGYILRFLPIGIGMGFFQSPNNSAVMGAAPRHRLGVASGLLSLTRTIGQTVGISVIGAIWAGQVSHLLGAKSALDTTTAPASIQVAALQSTFIVIIGLVAFALGLSLWALWKENRVEPTIPAINK